MSSFPNGHYTTMIRCARKDRGPTALPIGTTLDKILDELQFIRTYNIGQDIYLCDIQDRGGLLVCSHPGKYVGDSIDNDAEAMLLTVGLEETLKRRVIAALAEKFDNVAVTLISATV